MNKSLLVALALGAVLTSCDHRSDLRASEKVSLDQVPPGSRDTDIANLNGGTSDATHENGQGEHGAQPAAHGAEGAEQSRPDVMPNHDEHSSDIGGQDQVPATEKTTESKDVENHE
jgi:hypothetical protein